MNEQTDQNLEPNIIASFEFVPREEIQATFTISPNIQDLNYTHYQDVPQATWVVNHNLSKCPSVTVVTSSGEQVQADVNYKNLNSLEINFSGAFAGTAYLN